MADFARLAQAIRAASASRNWLQEDLIRESGVGRSTVQRLWKGASQVMPTLTIKSQLERTLGWTPGSIDTILDGGDPTPLSGSSTSATSAPEPPATADTQSSTLPLAARDVLEQGELLDTEVIDLSRPGADFHLLVVAKVGIKDDAEKREKMRDVIEQWLMLRKGIRDMADYRPGPDAAPDGSSDSPSGDA
jgi:hypothetical protein